MKTKIYESMAEFFPLWRETTLGKTKHEVEETQFILDVIKKSGKEIKTIIDLGGGVGLHSNLLQKKGFDVTCFDQSKKALQIAKKNNPKLKTIQGKFENIKVKGKYDMAICIWSTLSYIYTEKGRKNFYEWQKEHIDKLVILDEANYNRYSSNFYKEYEGENNDYKLKVLRKWKLTKNNLKKTNFIYELTNKKTGKKKIIKDAENEQYVSVEKLKKYFGDKWNMCLYGGYDTKLKYDKDNSIRIISVIQKL